MITSEKNITKALNYLIHRQEWGAVLVEAGITPPPDWLRWMFSIYGNWSYVPLAELRREYRRIAYKQIID